MVNYSDRFTDEQREELYNFSFIPYKELEWNDGIQGTPPELSEETRNILTDLFKEHREKYPDDYLTPIEAAIKAGEETHVTFEQLEAELDELILSFWYDVVFEIFKDRIEKRDDGTLWTKDDKKISKNRSIIAFTSNSFLSNITDKTIREQMQDATAQRNKQLQMFIDKKGNISIPDQEKYIKAVKNMKGVLKSADADAVNIILTAIEDDFINNGDGFMCITRKGLEDAIGTQIYQPTNDELNYILSKKKENIPAPETLGAVIDPSIELPTTQKKQKLFVSKTITTEDGKEKEIRVFKTREDYEKQYDDDIKKRFGIWLEFIDLQNLGVVSVGNKALNVFNFEGYDYDADGMLCNSPFMRHIIQEIYNNPVLGEIRNNKPSYEKKKITHRIYPKLKTVKNEAMKEVIYHIDYRLARRGLKTDKELKPYLSFTDNKQRSVNISYAEIIKNCPKIAEKIAPSITNEDKKEEIVKVKPQNKRNLLMRAIFGTDSFNKNADAKENPEIIKVIKEYTELYNYYLDLSITCDEISLKNLNTTGIHIKHHGKNGDYKDGIVLQHPDIYIPEKN